jgi:hypothetical protein
MEVPFQFIEVHVHESVETVTDVAWTPPTLSPEAA